MASELFDFIQDDRFKSILDRDYQELITLHKEKLSKSVLVMSGSLVEALLLEFLSNKPPHNKTSTQILKLTLADLIEVAESEGLISKTAKDLSTVIRNYRNLIHPAREIRKNESFDFESANVAVSVLNIIIKDIRKNYLLLYGYSAKDIVSKISQDSNSIHVFDQLIEKLSIPERYKLLSLVTNSPNYIPKQIEYVDKILAALPDENILPNLKRMVKAFETERKEVALMQFRFYRNYLGLLDAQELSFLIKYILHFLQNEAEISVLSEFTAADTFSKIAPNLSDNEMKELFLNTAIDYYAFQQQDSTVRRIYYSLISGIEPSKKSEVESYFDKQMGDNFNYGFQSRFIVDDVLPF